MDHIFRVVGEAVAREYFTLEESSKQGIFIIWEKKKKKNSSLSFGQSALTFAYTGPLPALHGFIDDLLEDAGLYSSRAH